MLRWFSALELSVAHRRLPSASPDERRWVTDSEVDLMRALHDEHAGPLWNYCLRLTRGDHVHAEDVTQETFVRAWRHPSVLARSPDSIRAWLFTVARNIVIDGVRAKSSRPRQVADSALSQLPAEDSVEDQVERAVLGWEVAEALADLPSHHRDVLVQTYYLGRSVSEAAAALRVPEGTVKSRAYYALRHLGVLLEERGVGPISSGGDLR
jgi:RNA polymerase sigma-70 factor, ECF subfamily